MTVPVLVRGGMRIRAASHRVSVVAPSSGGSPLAAVRAFTPTSLLVCAIGGLTSWNAGANTVAVLMKRTASADQGVATFHDSAAAMRNGLVIGSGANNNELGYQSNAGGTFVAGQQILTTDDWCVDALTKGAGTVAPIGYKCILGGADSEVTAANNVADHVANDLSLGSVRFGGAGFGDLSALVAVVGALNAKLTFADIKSLKLLWSNWVALFAGAGAGLWRFDQASTSDPVNDQTGNGANQTSLTGTSVNTTDIPPGFLV